PPRPGFALRTADRCQTAAGPHDALVLRTSPGRETLLPPARDERPSPPPVRDGTGDARSVVAVSSKRGATYLSRDLSYASCRTRPIAAIIDSYCDISSPSCLRPSRVSV